MSRFFFSDLFPFKGSLFFKRTGFHLFLCELFPGDLEEIIRDSIPNEELRRNYDSDIISGLLSAILNFAGEFELEIDVNMKNRKINLNYGLYGYEEFGVLIILDSKVNLNLIKYALAHLYTAFLQEHYNKLQSIEETKNPELIKLLKLAGVELLMRINSDYFKDKGSL